MRKLPIWIRRLPIRIKVLFQTIYFQSLSLARKSFSFDNDGVPVSIATYGHRERFVHLTIESIMAGHNKPSYICIWRDNDPKSTPSGLKRLTRQGIDVIELDRRHRSHKKWFGPATSENAIYDEGFVLADDDLIYPKFWLSEIQKVIGAYPSTVIAWRCRSIKTAELNANRKLAAYGNWGVGPSSFKPSFLTFATTGHGTFVPPSLSKALNNSGQNFDHIRLAPTADDVWLHVIAVRSRTPILGIDAGAVDWPQNPMQGTEGLGQVNNGQGKNDESIRACYSQEDVDFLAGQTD